MGLTPFACITLADSVRIVFPDGHVESLSRSCSVRELLLGNPDYYVCCSFPHSVANSMAGDEALLKGMTYFVCATPNAQPFIEFVPKKSSLRTARLLPRLPRHGIRGMREMRGRECGGAQARCTTKVFDVHSATMQQLESMRRAGERPSKHLHQLKLVFVRHCLQALRLPRSTVEFAEPAFAQFSNDDDPRLAPPPAMDVDVLPVFRSAARSELGLYVTRRQEFYLRRAKRRRKVVWKPVLQSISEMAAVVEFHAPASQDDSDCTSKRFSPPRPDSAAPPRKNISPPRQPVIPAAPVKNISPHRQYQAPAPKHSPAPLPQHRHRGNTRSLYMA